MEMKTKQDSLELYPSALDAKNDFVLKILSDKTNWSEDIVARLMQKAHVSPTPDEETCRKLACKCLWILWNSERIRGKGRGWIPTQSCVDLTTTGAALTSDEKAMSLEEVREKWFADENGAANHPGHIRTKTSRHVPRHFKDCLGCGKKFLAKRTNNSVCSSRCQQRAYRQRQAVRMSAIPATTPLEAA